MANIYPSLPRLSVKDSFDDEDLTDIDDEVFIRDGKPVIGIKNNDDCGVKMPLMAPRKKTKASSNFDNQKIPLRTLLLPMFYGAMALVILLGLILLCILTVNIFPVPLTVIKNLFPGKDKLGISTPEIMPCTSLVSSVVWVKTLPKLTSEAPLRSIDVNGDNIDDIIVGFSTGLDALDVPTFLCNLYFNGQTPCLGGVLALDGKAGDTLWTHWAEHAIFSIDCALDINNDKIKDCIITGRGGILHVIDGSDGTVIWKINTKEFSVMEEEIILDVYDARYINDIDGDDIGDVIVSHTIQGGEIRSSEIIVVSGKTGDNIKNIEFPKNEQLFIAPLTLVHPDGEIIYLLSSSTPEQSGGLYVIPQANLLYGNMELKTLQHGKGKGILLSPILIDITSDGTSDIIVPSLDSNIRAYNGLTFELIWNYTVPNSEVISIPIPGYYNDDDIPDIMVKHQIGPGFPVYYYSLSTILDGKTGKPLLEQSIKDSGNGQMSGLSLSVDGTGNDWFLYWSANCLNHGSMEEKYRFLKGQTLLSQSRANLCKLRFNTTLNTRLMAMSQHVGPPGQSLYFSEDWKSVELNNTVDARKESEEYFKNNIVSNDDEINNAMENGPMVAQRSAKGKSLFTGSENFNVDESNDPGNEQIDFILKDGQGKKESDSYPVFNDISDLNSKVPNGYPNEMDWTNTNNWNTLRFENDMTYNERNDDIESGQKNQEPIQQNTFIESSLNLKKKRNVRDINNSENADKSIQRQPPTGLLLPSLTNIPNKVSIDLIFTTYWLPPSEVSLVLLQPDLECIKMREEKASKKLELNERENIIADCLATRGINYKKYKEGLDRENVKFSLGQMTVYRIKLECVCPDDLLPGQSCKNISSYQRWPAHLGQSGDGYFEPYRNFGPRR